MSSINFLSLSDFSESRGKLKVSIPQFGLVLFWSSNCKYCTTAKDILALMNRKVNGCNFGMVNLDMNRELIDMCNKSGIALEHVPFFVFFANHTPYMVYSGPVAIEPLTKFVIEVSTQYHEENKPKMTGRTNTIAPPKQVTDSVDSCKIGDTVCQQQANSYQSGRSGYCTIKEAYANKNIK